MKTNEKFISFIVLGMCGKPFEQMDWEGYPRCESEDPHIAYSGGFTIIADGNNLVIVDKDGDETYLRLVCTL